MEQAKTQKKYLLRQIAALKVYVGYAAKGYSIVTKGLQAIQDIKRGDFTLHNNFFNALSAVNGRVKQYSKVAAIIALQTAIAKQVHTTIRDCGSAKQLTPSELQYLGQVFDGLLDACAKNLDELLALLKDGELQMKDDERIKRIDNLYADMQDKQMFLQTFSNAAKGLSEQRRNDQKDIEIQRKVNGIK